MSEVNERTEPNRLTQVRAYAVDIVTSIVGTAGGQAVSIIAVPLLARIYSPAHFGAWALYLAVVALGSQVASMRLDIAVVAAKTPKLAKDTLITTSLLITLGTLILSVVVFAVEMLSGAAAGSRVGWVWLSWSPIGVCSAALYLVLTSWWLRTGAYRLITVARVGLPIGTSVLQFAFYQIPDGAGLVIGNALAQTITVAWMAAQIAPQLKGWCGQNGFKLRALALLVRFRRFALFTMPYSLQGQFFKQATIVLLASLTSVATSGYYAIAQRCVYNPLAMVASALEQATYPRIARSPNDAAIHDMIARTMLGLGVFLGVVCAIATLYGGPIIGLVLGEEWRSATSYVVATAYATASLLLSSWIVRVFDLFGRQKLHLIVDVSANAIILAGFLVGFYVSHSPAAAVNVLCAGYALYYVVWTVLAFHVAGMNKRRLIKIYGVTLASWALTLGLCLCVQQLS